MGKNKRPAKQMQKQQGKKPTVRQEARHTDRKLEVALQAIDERFRAQDAQSAQIFRNQQILANSEERLDEQFAVLARLAFGRMNQLTEKWNAFVEGQKRGELVAETLPLITYDEVNVTFAEFTKYRARSDFKDHYPTWFMGGDLSKLPPPPEPPKEPEAKTSEELAASAVELDEMRAELDKSQLEEKPTEESSLITNLSDLGIPDGAQVFGGDVSPKEEKDVGSKGGDPPKEAQAERGPAEAVQVSGV